MNRYHIITVQEKSVTNTQPARVVIKSEKNKETIVIPYDNEPGEHNFLLNTAIRYLQKQGFEIVGDGEGAPGKLYLISTTFKHIKPA